MYWLNLLKPFSPKHQLFFSCLYVFGILYRLAWAYPNCKWDAVLFLQDKIHEILNNYFMLCSQWNIYWLYILVYFSFFSSAWLCQQSSWNRNSSVVRPSVRLWHRLSLKLLYGFLSNFSCGFPWAISPDAVFQFWKKKIFWFFTNIFRFR